MKRSRISESICPLCFSGAYAGGGGGGVGILSLNNMFVLNSFPVILFIIPEIIIKRLFR